MKKEFEYTALINAMSVAMLPLLAMCTPKVVEMSPERSVVKIRLGWRTRNHLGVMYFGALAMGAELSIALKAIQGIRESGQKIDFLFKDFKAEFLRRADGHVHFICDQAAQVSELVQQTADSSERFNRTFEGRAVLADHPEEVVMTYSLTLTMKNRSRKS